MTKNEFGINESAFKRMVKHISKDSHIPQRMYKSKDGNDNEICYYMNNYVAIKFYCSMANVFEAFSWLEDMVEVLNEDVFPNKLWKNFYDNALASVEFDYHIAYVSEVMFEHGSMKLVINGRDFSLINVEYDEVFAGADRYIGKGYTKPMLIDGMHYGYLMQGFIMPIKPNKSRGMMDIADIVNRCAVEKGYVSLPN